MPAQAARLARRVGRADAGRWRGRRGRRAVARLRQVGGGRGSPVVLDAVWAEWLRRPADPLWRLLAGWNRPARWAEPNLSVVALGGRYRNDSAAYGECLVAAFDLRTPAGASHPVARAAAEQILAAGAGGVLDPVFAAATAEPAGALAAFCVEHGLAPADPAAQVVFLLRTGQLAQYGAVDPDGSLLARVYAAAPAGDRALLRAALVTAGGLDLLRVVAGQAPDRVARMSPAEIDYLADRLATERDWDRLWRLVAEVSPARALALVGRFPAGWQPASARDQRLFDVLRTAPPDVVAATVAPFVRRLRLTGKGHPQTLSFAPDGSQLAVIRRRPDRLTVHRLPGGEPVWSTELDGAWSRTVVHLGGDTVVVSDSELYRLTWTGPEVVREPLGRASALIQAPGGFAAFDRDATMLVGGRGGAVTRVPVAGVGGALTPGDGEFAVHHGTGRFALHSWDRNRGRLLLLEPAGRVLARATLPAGGGRLAFVAADLLIVAGFGRGTLWRQDGARLVAATSVPVGGSYGLCPVGTVDKIAVGDGDARWFSTASLTPVTAPYLTLDDGDQVCAAPRADWLAVPAADGAVEAYQLRLPAWLARLVDQPVVAANPANLRAAAAGAAAVAVAADGVAAAVAGVVRACLEHRFGSDFEVAAGGGPIGEDYDIGVGPPPADGPAERTEGQE
ncbi:MAG: hypothetical protein V7637_108 [Mycobacteriales bacterium]